MEQLSMFGLLAETTTKKTNKPTKQTNKSTNETTNNAKLKEKVNANSKQWTTINPQTINDILLTGYGFEGGKKRIFEFFKQENDESKRAEMLKKEYGIGGSSPVCGCSINYDAKGLQITHRTTHENLILSWRNVAERIGKLIHYKLYYA